MNPLYPQVTQRAENRCEYCHAPERAANFPFEVEHIMPSASGGSSAQDNLALSCRSCNAFKGVRQTGTDLHTQVATPLFHPRTDDWSTHFVVDAQTLEINGLTAVGRATVVALKMNTPAQLTARREWRRLDLFP